MPVEELGIELPAPPELFGYVEAPQTGTCFF
jgi:hypothetical protein